MGRIPKILTILCVVLPICRISIMAQIGNAEKPIAELGKFFNAQETLQQYIADLQKNPDNQELREKIIKLVLTMNPKPAVPDEVATHEGAAEYAFKNAKTAADFADAAKEYEKALLAAPWLAADYFNCGVAHEKAGNFDAAIRNFNLYLIAAPDATDATDVRKHIGAVKYQSEKEAEVAEEQQRIWRQQAEQTRRKEAILASLREKLAGNWYMVGDSDRSMHYEFEVQGEEIAYSYVWDVTHTYNNGKTRNKGERVTALSLPIQWNATDESVCRCGGSVNEYVSNKGEIRDDEVVVDERISSPYNRASHYIFRRNR